MQNPLHHIQRKDNDGHGTHLWLVQVQRHNLNIRRTFTDLQWGGKRKALAAAKAWRDEQMDAMTQYAYEVGRRNVMRRNNKSGLVGVARYVKPAGKRGKGYTYWMASWVDERGVSVKRKFGVGRYGEQAAKQMAMDVREREMRRCVAARTEVR